MTDEIIKLENVALPDENETIAAIFGSSPFTLPG